MQANFYLSVDFHVEVTQNQGFFMKEIIKIESLSDTPLIMSQESDFWISLKETGLSKLPINIDKYSTGRVIVLDSTNQKTPVFVFDINHRNPTAPPKARKKSIEWNVCMSFEEFPIIGDRWAKSVEIKNNTGSVQELTLYFSIIE